MAPNKIKPLFWASLLRIHHNLDTRARYKKLASRVQLCYPTNHSVNRKSVFEVFLKQLTKEFHQLSHQYFITIWRICSKTHKIWWLLLWKYKHPGLNHGWLHSKRDCFHCAMLPPPIISVIPVAIVPNHLTVTQQCGFTQVFIKATVGYMELQ